MKTLLVFLMVGFFCFLTCKAGYSKSLEKNIEKRIDVGRNVKALRLEGKLGNIDIRGWEKDYISIKSSTEISKKEGKIKLEDIIESIDFSDKQKGDALIVTSERMDTNEPISIDERVEMKIPSRLQLVIKGSHTIGLRINIKDVYGGFLIDANFPKLRISNKKLFGDVRIKATEAHVEFELQERPHKKVDFVIDSRFGDIKLELPTIIGDINIKSTDADVSVLVRNIDLPQIKELKIDSRKGKLESNFLNDLFQWDPEGTGIFRLNKKGTYSIVINNNFGEVKFNQG